MNTVVLSTRWAGMEIRRLSALARTQLTVIGAVDGVAIAHLRQTIAEELAEGHDVWIDIDQITSVRRAVVGELCELAPWVA